MKKGFLFSILIVAFLLTLSLGVSALPTAPKSIIDDATLLSAQEQQLLEQEAEKIGNEYALDIVILTVQSTNGRSPRQYAESYYDSNGYAPDGILLLISMDERDWYICTTGNAQQILTSRKIDQLGDEFVSFLSSGSYYEGFSAFLTGVADNCSHYRDGKSSSSGIQIIHVAISLLVGIAVGGITILIMRSSMKSTKRQHSASEYIMRDSFRLNAVHDMFLYSRVTKTPVQTNSSGGHGGGGHRHGGGGGKF